MVAPSGAICRSGFTPDVWVREVATSAAQVGRGVPAEPRTGCAPRSRVSGSPGTVRPTLWVSARWSALTSTRSAPAAWLPRTRWGQRVPPRFAGTASVHWGRAPSPRFVPVAYGAARVGRGVPAEPRAGCVPRSRVSGSPGTVRPTLRVPAWWSALTSTRSAPAAWLPRTRWGQRVPPRFAGTASVHWGRGALAPVLLSRLRRCLAARGVTQSRPR
jgi:hypothetical protein